MTLEMRTFRSRLALRVYVLFVVSALFPMLILAFFSFGYLKSRLDQDLQQHLHDTAKAYAYRVFERLALADSDLGLLQRRDSAMDPPGPAFASLLNMRFRGIALLDRQFQVRQRLGDRFPIPPSLQRLARPERANPALLLTAPHEGDGPIMLARPLGVTAASAGWVVALFEPDYLWGRADELDADIRYCVRDPDGLPLFCQNGEPEHADDRSRTWSLFIGARFQDAHWSVRATTRDTRLADTLGGYGDILPRVMLLSLLVVALLSIYLIRSNFLPLERLMEGIRRITANDFSEPVRVDSRDELGTIADAFNQMARQIQEHLQRLTALSTIDKAILARSNRDQVIEAVLRGAADAIAADLVCIGVREADGNGFQFHLQRTGDPDIHGQLVRLDPDTPARLAAGRLQLGPTDDLYQTLAGPLGAGDCRQLILLPVLDRQRLQAVFGLGYSTTTWPGAEQPEQAEEFAHRVAVALADAAREERLQYLAYHDALTDLPNRLLLKDRLDQALAQARREKTSVALLFVDLDRFKSVNDSLGHNVGDALLKELGVRLLRTVRNGDTVARLGGDEFVLVVADLQRRTDPSYAITPIARKVLQAAAAPFQLAEHEIRLTTSIGIAVYPEDGQNPDSLLKNGDAAMYHAKQEGRNNYQFYSAEFNARALSRLDMAAAMHRALESDEFRVFFQPKLDLRRRRVSGVEALLRWTHRERGLLLPEEFIGLAEETGFIIELGRWTLMQACDQANAWRRDRGDTDFSVSVNISPRQFNQEGLLELVREALATSGLPPQALELEITEGTAMGNPERTLDTLHGLRGLGVKVSLDDFGMGYSSLGYLKHFPVDVLKIDKSFVEHMTESPADLAIVKSTIVLAHSLGLQVVAEGVETQAQLELLQGLDCDMVQGFICSPPVGEDRFTALLEHGVCANLL